MKSFKRLLSLVLVCMLFLGAFSTTASANNDYDLSTLSWSPQVRFTDNTFSVGGENRPLTHLIHFNGLHNSNQHVEFPQQLRFNYTSSDVSFSDFTSIVIVEEGDGFTVELNNLCDRIVFYDANDNEISSRYRTAFNPTEVAIVLYKLDRTYTIVTPDDYSVSLNGNRINFSVSINAVPHDIARFTVIFWEDTFPYGGSRPDFYSYFSRQMTFDQQSSHVVKRIPEEKGFFKSILSWLADIRGGLTNLGNSIVELPSKIGNAILEGIKSLFVPDEQYILNYKSNWEDLLSGRFGAIFDVGEKLIELAQTIYNSMLGEPVTSITFPRVHIPLLGNGSSPSNTLAFGGWDIPIQVDGIQFFYNLIKGATGVSATFLFLNGLRRRYDEIIKGG